MELKDPNELIGKQVIYFDYLGEEHHGSIVAIEPCILSQNELYIYINDEDQDFNIHQDIVNGVQITYAELRPSSEVILDIG